MEKKVFKTPTLLPKTSKSSTALNSTCLIWNKPKVAGGLPKIKSSLTLNSTICEVGTSRQDITSLVPQETTSRKQFVAYEIDLAYNEYLLTVIKKQNVLKITQEHKEILNGQIEYQVQRMSMKKEQQHVLQQEIDQIDEKIQLIELLDSLHLVVNKLEVAYNRQEISTHLKTLSAILSKECDKVVLQNVNKIETQEEYDRFIEVLKKILEKTETMVNSGRNFEKMNELAEKIRMYFKLRNEIQRKEEKVFTAYENSVYDMLQQLSNIFSMQYESLKEDPVITIQNDCVLATEIGSDSVFASATIPVVNGPV